MNKAKQVVETWARQFHCSPRDQRLAFLYLANDILQNSRRKGAEFVGEFWKVLPDALRDVIDHGDEFGRNSALRLVNILDERKVFGSRGQVLKEELVGRHRENSIRNGKPSTLKLKQPAGNALDKIVSGYQTIYGGQVDEDAVISKCVNAISFVEKVDKETGGDIKSAQASGSVVADELKGQHATLRDCIEQLKSVESSRTNLVSYLREALQEQAAHAQSEKADNFCRQLLHPSTIQSLPEHGTKEIQSPQVQGYIPRTNEQLVPVMYTRQAPQSEDTKSAAAAVAAKLTASTSSAEMLTYVLSSLASEGVIGNSRKESPSNDYPLPKRTKMENNQPLPPLSSQHDQPPPPSSPPPQPPMPPMQPYPAPYSHNINQQPPPLMPLPGFPTAGPPVNGASPYTPGHPSEAYQNYQIEGGFYSQQSTMPMAPVSRQ
ncbi:regulation of nuclear pre-mRNA domain-containing protein 1A-like protein isoform X2 [Tanacetum coccineum]